jgi:hypothetical protein
MGISVVVVVLTMTILGRICLAYNPAGIWKATDAFVAVKIDGSIHCWGSSSSGGDCSAYSGLTGVTAITSTMYAVAATLSDGSVVCWGDSTSGGSCSGLTGVSAVSSTYRAFSALHNDGSVTSWGSSDYGGAPGVDVSSNVILVVGAELAFAALKSNGDVVAWGDGNYGGTSTTYTSVTSIFASKGSFGVIKTTGAVECWGSDGDGFARTDNVASDLTTGVVSVYVGAHTAAALKSDGSVVTWGRDSEGGDSTTVDVSSNVDVIFSSYAAFAALKTDGSVVSWGDADYGGNSGAVSSDLSSGVIFVYSNEMAFAALKDDGSLVTWGDLSTGGDSSAVASDLTSVISVTSSQKAFAALTAPGVVVVWGDGGYGGSVTSAEMSLLSSGVTAIYASEGSFVALKTDSIVTWGDSTYSGSDLSSGVDSVYGFNTFLSDSTTHDAFQSSSCTAGSGKTVIASDGTVSYTSSCTACPTGSYDTGALCAYCRAGTYETGTGSTSCTKCDAGKASGVAGATAPSSCITCVAGSYAVAGSSSCSLCPAGKYGTTTGGTALSSCSSCEAGTASSAAGATAASECVACTAGKSAIEGEECYPCVAGRYMASPNAASCLSVEENFGVGYISSDKISVEYCDKNYGIDLTGVGVDNVEISAGSSTQSCTRCGFSRIGECAISDEVSFFSYSDLETFSYKTCAHQCELFTIGASDNVIVAISILLVLFFVTGLYFIERKSDKVTGDMTYNWKQSIAFLVFVIIPVADTVTDVTYLLGSVFYEAYFFYAGVLAMMIPNFAFCFLLYKRDRVLLKYKPLMPLYGCIPLSLKFEHHDNIVKAIVFTIIHTPYFLLNVPIVICKLFLGMMLYCTKIFAIAGVYNRWMMMWTGKEDDYVRTPVDKEILNESIYVEIIGETFPQVLLQTLNNLQVNPNFATWGTINLMSLSVTILNTGNGIWKIGYWKLFLGVGLVDIPVELGFEEKENDMEKGEEESLDKDSRLKNDKVYPLHSDSDDHDDCDHDGSDGVWISRGERVGSMISARSRNKAVDEKIDRDLVALENKLAGTPGQAAIANIRTALLSERNRNEELRAEMVILQNALDSALNPGIGSVSMAA